MAELPFASDSHLRQSEVTPCDIVETFVKLRGAINDLSKKPHSKRGRLILLVLEIWGGLTALAIIALLLFESTALINAALWHMRHGNTVSFDGHVFHLPRSWYPDPDSHPGQFGLQHAQFGSVDISHITLATRPQTLNGQAAVDLIAAMTAHLNQHELVPLNRWTNETLRSRTLTFHCAMQSTQGFEETLICQAADSNLTILEITGGSSARAEALNILETSE